MTLVLHQTDFASLDGFGPDIIDLKAGKTIIGRGSQTMPVDITVCARKEGMDIISRNHAAITRTADGNYCVQDLKALNGTYVNSEKISTRTLRHGDILQFGGTSSVPNGQSAFCVRYVFQADFPNQGRSIQASPRNNKKKNADQVGKKKGTKRGVKSTIDNKNEDGDDTTFDFASKEAGTQKKKKLNISENVKYNDITAPKVRTVVKIESELQIANIKEHEVPIVSEGDQGSKNPFNNDKNDEIDNNNENNNRSSSSNNSDRNRSQNQNEIMNLKQKWIGDEFSIELGRLKTELAVLKETIRSSETEKLKKKSSSSSSPDLQAQLSPLPYVTHSVPRSSHSTSLPISTSKSNFSSSSTPTLKSQSLPLQASLPTSKSTSDKKWGTGKDFEKKPEGIQIFSHW